MVEVTKGKVASGFFWTFTERICAQGISFIVSIVLARILMPEQYGSVSLLLVFINIANVFVSNGFGEALIRKKDANEEEYTSMFWCSLALGVIIYFILFFAAPFISTFYNNQDMIWLIRIMALKVPISAVSTIQHAYVSNNMLFKKFFFATLIGTIISGFIGVGVALAGYGAWALVAQYLSNTCIDMLVLFTIVKWKPSFLFNGKAAKGLLGFGMEIMVSSLINTIYAELRSLVIGKRYSSEDLAFYNKANQFPSLIIINVNTAVGNVMYPTLSKVSDDRERLKTMMRTSMMTTAYVIFPLLAGMAVIAEPLICVLLTDKWIQAVPYMQLSCLYWACQPIQTANWQALKALGKGRLCVTLEIIKKVIGVSLLFVSMRISVYAIVVSLVITGIVATMINMIPISRLLNYSVWNQLCDLLPTIGMTIVMCFGLKLCDFLSVNNIFLIIIKIICGIVIYFILSAITKNQTFRMLISMVKNFLQKNIE